MGREDFPDMGPAQQHEHDDDGPINGLPLKDDELITGTRIKGE